MKIAKVFMVMALFFSAGCVTSDFFLKKAHFDNFYVSSYFPEFYVKDVAFVPFSSQAGLSRDQLAMINEVFVTELRKRNWYRVQVMDNVQARDFSRLEKIDAVISGEVINYQEQEPLKLGLQVSMRYLNTGQTAWSASNVFDASSRETVSLLKKYYREKKYAGSSLWEHKAYLISIKKYAEFCSSVLIDTIKEGWEKELALNKNKSGGKR